MYVLRTPVIPDPEIANDLAIITDALYTRTTGSSPGNALEYLLVRDDVGGVVATLSAGANRLLDVITATRPDEAGEVIADLVASNLIGEVWCRPDRVGLGKALLRIELDDGRLDDLDDEMREMLTGETGPEVVITMAQLVTGMSYLIGASRGEEPGDAIRKELGC